MEDGVDGGHGAPVTPPVVEDRSPEVGVVTHHPLSMTGFRVLETSTIKRNVY